MEQDWIKAPPKKILFATDLSARCDRALDRAAALAVAWHAELVAVHALEQSEDFYAKVLDERLPSWPRQTDPAKIVEEQLRHDIPPSVRVTAVAEKGDPVDLVMRAAKTHGCDLIVTGIARDETLGRFGLGATVDRLLRRSRIPLLVVKERARRPYGNIVVATDFSASAQHALRAAAAFFPDRKLDVFHAFNPPAVGLAPEPDRYRAQYRETAVADCNAFLAASGIPQERAARFGVIIEEGRPGELIRQYARDRGVDLVVLGTHGRSALFDMVIGSTAKEILSTLSCDALVVREPRAAVEGEKA